MQVTPQRVFYHGISKEMLFESTFFHGLFLVLFFCLFLYFTNNVVYGPMSTTVEFPVAQRFAEDGMVIDLLNTGGAAPLFNCQFWSDFTEENERFFIGSLQEFNFDTIHHLSLGLDYQVFIRRIGILMTMIRGWPYEISEIHQGDFQCLSDLISDHINNTHSDSIPFYIHKLFKFIVQNVKKIYLEVLVMDHNTHPDGTMFGYKALKPLFFVDNQVNYCKLCQIFNQKLQRVVISSIAFGDFAESVHLNSSFLEQILFGIQTINENITLKSVFNEILIVNPYESIDQFIDENQVLFVMNEWKLKKTNYEDKRRINAKSDNVLSITPL